MMMDELFHKAKVLSDSFLAAKFPGKYIKISLKYVEEQGKPSEILCRIEVYKKTFLGNELVRKIAYTIKKERHFHKYSACLASLSAEYGAKSAEMSDSD